MDLCREPKHKDCHLDLISMQRVELLYVLLVSKPSQKVDFDLDFELMALEMC